MHEKNIFYDFVTRRLECHREHQCNNTSILKRFGQKIADVVLYFECVVLELGALLCLINKT